MRGALGALCSQLSSEGGSAWVPSGIPTSEPWATAGDCVGFLTMFWTTRGENIAIGISEVTSPGDLLYA